MPERLTVFLIVDNEPDAEDDFYALTGVVEREGEEEVWRGQEGRWLPLDPDWRQRRREVTEDVRDLLGPADYFLPVVVRPLPDGLLDGVPLGWKLPL
ncbi:hypothetical protein [Deinococcus planocerae]|uniref:hypothetical protein n=1 Tax=Deinococcus planocerae TaxID=1737569 RepID=UPI0015E145BA|nr:hypothetical protein [Deinococcus planocerae]